MFITIRNYIIDNIINWIITGIITFISVKIATNKYYDFTKKQVSKGIMELGLRSLLKLEYDESIPDYAQAVFVKYKGRCYKTKKARENSYCKFGDKIRRTIEVVGGNKLEVSPFRPLNYGVLGVANYLSAPLLYDFRLHKLYMYKKGYITELCVIKEGSMFVYKINDRSLSLSNEETQRDVMLAIPLKSNGKLVGGITFDLKPGDKTIYQKYSDKDTEETKEQKTINNIKVFKEATRASFILINAYFKEKGDELE